MRSDGAPPSLRKNLLAIPDFAPLSRKYGFAAKDDEFRLHAHRSMRCGMAGRGVHDRRAFDFVLGATNRNGIRGNYEPSRGEL